MSSSESARADLVSPSAVELSAPSAPSVPKLRWHPLTRIGFRFAVLYLGLIWLTTGQVVNGIFGQILAWLPFNVPTPGSLGVVRKMANHIAINWWGFAEPIKGWHPGGGDKPFDWAMVFGVLLISLGGTVLWSAIDWKRLSYPRLNSWFRLCLRLEVGAQMVIYGFMKAFPSQMPFPGLMQLMSPYGQMNLMGVLWSQVGSSPAYEIFTGCAELLAAVLLLIPGLTTVGALVGIAVTSQVWILNMTFDVPVKNLSMHLMIMCIVLLVPDIKRLFVGLVLNRSVEGRRDARFFNNVIAHRVVIALQLVFATHVLYTAGTRQYQSWRTNRSNQPKPPLYGIWNVDKMFINGVERAALINDYDRYRRIVFDYPNSVTFQRTNDAFTSVPARVDLAAKTIKFTTDVPSRIPRPPGTPTPPVREFGQVTIEQPSSDQLILEGTINGRQVRLESTYWDPHKFRLKQAKFRWIQ